MMFHKCTLCFWVIISLLPVVHANEIKRAYDDTLYIKKGTSLVVNNKIININSDTIVVLPSYFNYKIIPEKNEVNLKKVTGRIRNSFWYKELHNIIVVEPTNDGKSDTVATRPSAQEFYRFANRPIRKIFIKQLPVFGPTISDTTRVATSFLEKAGNNIHFQTRRYLIKKNILFKEKDLVNPDVFSDNERIIRALPYIDDTKISIIPCPGMCDSVDVYVYVKDIWTIAINVQVDGLKSGTAEFTSKNVLGLGQEISEEYMWDDSKYPTYGYEGIYYINNMGGSFISGTLSYYHSFGTEALQLNLSRDFFTPNTKYAGGFLFNNTISTVRYVNASVAAFLPVEYNHYETWIGRSYKLTKDYFSKNRQNITFSAKNSIDHYYQRPSVSEFKNYSYQNKEQYLLSVSYTNQNYFKSNLIYNFWKTEDIPVGTMLSFTGGFENNEFKNRYYVGTDFAIGKYLGKFGYVETGFTYSSFLKNHRIEQGVVLANLNYFSNLFVFDRYSLRQFVTIKFTGGINRYYKESINMNNKNGIIGLTNDSVWGNKRLNMDWETDCFTPWKLLGFRFVLFAYANHVWISRPGDKLLNVMPYTGFGLGMRIRNPHLVFNTIQIRFTFYPNIPSNSLTTIYNISGEQNYSPANFSPKAPSVTTYQ